MKTIGLWMIIAGLAIAAAFLIAGSSRPVPWSTSSAVLFGLGLAYAGLCGRHADGMEGGKLKAES